MKNNSKENTELYNGSINYIKSKNDNLEISDIDLEEINFNSYDTLKDDIIKNEILKSKLKSCLLFTYGYKDEYFKELLNKHINNIEDIKLIDNPYTNIKDNIIETILSFEINNSTILKVICNYKIDTQLIKITYYDYKNSNIVNSKVNINMSKNSIIIAYIGKDKKIIFFNNDIYDYFKKIKDDKSLKDFSDFLNLFNKYNLKKTESIDDFISFLNNDKKIFNEIKIKNKNDFNKYYTHIFNKHNKKIKL